MRENYDFSGWATVNDRKCSDGRTIRHGAFAEQDGQTVPLVWQHMHDSPVNVLGHALLEARPEGMYAYGKFNDTEMGQIAKEQVSHGDITSLSIHANRLQQKGGDVLHGVIREVSLVLAGANPGAFIDVPVIEHSDGQVVDSDEAIIYTGEALELAHAEEQKSEKEKEPVAEEKKETKETKETNEKTVKDVFDELTEEQKNVVYFMIGQALEDAGVSPEGEEGEEVEHSDDIYEGEENEMRYNVFDAETRQENVLTHDDMKTILKDAKRLGSLKEAVLEHSEEGGVLFHDGEESDTQSTSTYGIQQLTSTMAPNYDTYGIDMLFPQAHNLNPTPEFLNRDTGWVSVVMNGVHHTPFSRIKSQYADITLEEARALGYTKGNRKKEEVFTLLKRETFPQTVYKKQKLDRDDVIDVTDFDVVAWIKGEMRMKLDEEIARAILIGDGRLPDSEDKIKETNIRPILSDDDLFTVKVTVPDGNDDAANAKNLIDSAIRSRKLYKGSGNPKFFTSEDVLSEMLLLEDGINHKLYKSDAEVATAMRASSIVTCPYMENLTKNGNKVLGILVNLTDYNVGADKGGSINMFDDFDIDFNQMKYLIETRCSGALIKPFSAIVFTLGE